MANQIKQNKEKTTISIIKDSARKPTNSHEEINKLFRSFYANLYFSIYRKRPKSRGHQLISLNSNDLPQLNKEQTNILDSPITQDDFSTALNLMSSPHVQGYF